VWIEINSAEGQTVAYTCHSLYGECGLKCYDATNHILLIDVTLCMESVWIEITASVMEANVSSSLSVWRVCGLKSQHQLWKLMYLRHSLYGECGLK